MATSEAVTVILWCVTGIAFAARPSLKEKDLEWFPDFFLTGTVAVTLMVVLSKYI